MTDERELDLQAAMFHESQIEPTAASESALNGLCVGDYLISKLDDGSIWIRKHDGEGGGFDAVLFETFLNDFFNENF